MKRKVIFFLILIITGLGIYGYYWYTNTAATLNKAEESIERANKYDTLKAGIDAEIDRCEKFITQEQGDFANFEYCKKFIDWANKTL